MSEGKFYIEELEENSGIYGYFLPLDGVPEGGDWETVKSSLTTSISQNDVFIPFGTMALYAPIAYMPQAFGIVIARLFTQNYWVIYFSGVFSNIAVMAFIFYFAARLLPVGKKFLFLIAMMPMNLHQTASYSADVFVTALSCLMIAFALHLRFVQKDKISIKEYIFLYASAISIGLMKVVYLPVCLFYLIIPRERFGGRKKYIFHAVIVALAAGILTLLWLYCTGDVLSVPSDESDKMAQLQNILGLR